MRNRLVAFALLAASMSGSPAFAGLLYSQPSDYPSLTRSSLTASQIDTTPNGLGNFATAFDNFTLASASQVNSITWQGGYFLPALAYSLTAFQIKIYGDSSGKPGTLLDTINISSTAANAVLVGGEVSPNLGNEYIDNYSANVGSISLDAGKYWLSIVAELPYQSSPPYTIGQWGWHSGTGGDGVSLSTMNNTTSQVGQDLAFSLSGTPATATPTVPEPSSLVLCGIAGLASLVIVRLWQGHSSKVRASLRFPTPSV